MYVKYILCIFIGVVMKSKLITVNSFVKMSFRCNYEMGSYKASDETALRFLMQLDVGKLILSSLVDNTHLNSVHQEVPVAKMLNAIVDAHRFVGSYGLSVSVEDYEFTKAEKPDLMLPWVYHTETRTVISLKTNFCDLELLKSSEGDTFTFSGHAPTFVAHIMQGTYASVEDACAVFEDTYQRLLKLYFTTVNKAGVAAIVLPDTPPDLYTVHTEVGDVLVRREDRVTKYGATTHLIYIPWKLITVRVYCEDEGEMREFIHKRLIESLRVELDYY